MKIELESKDYDKLAIIVFIVVVSILLALVLKN